MKGKKNEFNVINPNAAGIDVSSEDYYVAVPPDRDDKPVRQFGCFTCDLHQIAKWLMKCNIETVAMESTNVYWIQLFLLLQDYGFEVFLVNARQIKNVSGKKTDIEDCQWIQQLHTYGLLSNSFQPDNITRELRTYVRQRKNLSEASSKEVTRMQKSLTLMNIKLDRVISDIVGKSGKAIIEAILQGERDPYKLVQLTDGRLKASKETLIKSLEADWRKEHLFTLRQSYDLFNVYKSMMAECDHQIEILLNSYPKAICKKVTQKNGNNPFKRKQKQKTDFNFSPDDYLKSIHGIDVTKIPGFSSVTAVTILSETGSDLSLFPSKKQFLSWLNIIPDNKISGGRIISSQVKKKKNKTGQSFRLAANALKNSKCPIGDYFRKIKSREGHGRAIVATAHKLASIYYVMVTKKMEFDFDYYVSAQKCNIEKHITRLHKKIGSLQKQLAQATVLQTV
jgi:transposase